MAQFRIKEHCTKCGHKWTFTAFSYTDDASDVADPECPKCSNVQTDVGLDVAAGKAPAIGGNKAVKAMDLAAKITMEDYGLTDLSSDGRPGSTMVPKIRPDLQQSADIMFDSKKRREKMSGNSAIARAINAMVAAGPSLAKHDPVPNPNKAVEMIHKAAQRVPVNIINQTADGRVIQ